MDEDKEEYSLYTEKIVLSPKVRYRWLIKLIKITLFMIVMFGFGVIFTIYLLPVLENYFNKKEEPPKDIIYIEKDSYIHNDEQYEEDPDIITEKDLKENYDAAMATLHSRVDMVQRCTVTVDNVKQVTDVPILDTEFTTASAGLIVADLNSQYMILTSDSQIDMDRDIIVGLNDGSYVKAEVWCNSDNTGLALLTVKENMLTPEQKKAISVAALDNSYKVKQGDMVILTGRIRGTINSIDFGVVSGLSVSYGKDNGYGILETNISRMSGDYGFLFNSEGRVIGVSSNTEDSVLKVMGISDLKAQIERLINEKKVLYCGISGQNVTKELAETYNLPMGIYVASVDIDSPAYVSGLQAGDVIVRVGDDDVLTIQEFSEKLYKCSEGDSLIIRYKRLGKDEYNEVATYIVVRTR